MSIVIVILFVTAVFPNVSYASARSVWMPLVSWSCVVSVELPDGGIPELTVVPSILKLTPARFPSDAVKVTESMEFLLVTFPTGETRARMGGALSTRISVMVSFCTFPTSSVAVIRRVVFPSGMDDMFAVHDVPECERESDRETPLFVTALAVTLAMLVTVSVASKSSVDRFAYCPLDG